MTGKENLRAPLFSQHGYPDREVFLDMWRVDRRRGSAQPLEGQRIQWASPRELDPQQFLAADL